MTERLNKWATIEPERQPVTTNLDAIDVSDEALLLRAACDLAQEFIGFIVTGKTARQALAELDCWRGWLETVREHSR